ATAFTHYYAFVLLLAFVGFLVAASPPALRWRLGGWAALGVAPCISWLFRVWSFNRAFSRAHASVPGAPAAPQPQQHLWDVLGPERNHFLLLLAGAGLALLAFRALRRRLGDRSAGVALLCWC